MLEIEPVATDSPVRLVVDEADDDGTGGGNILPLPEDRPDDGVAESVLALSSCC